MLSSEKLLLGYYLFYFPFRINLLIYHQSLIKKSARALAYDHKRVSRLVSAPLAVLLLERYGF
jgi:hypothetical protein